MKEDIKSMTLPELTTWMSALGEKGFRAKQLYNWMHKNLVSSFDEMTNLSGALKSKLKEQADFVVLTPVDVRISSIDGTRKYLFRLQDGNVIESVLMRYRFGNSVCISTQVGCRMGCRFCASTLDGLVRSLRPSEMLEQIYRIQKDIGERISNVVLMGSGEPFDNTENVFRFLDLISCEEGLNISQRNLTISTCGLIPGIEQLTARHSQVTLALSLRAAHNALWAFNARVSLTLPVCHRPQAATLTLRSGAVRSPVTVVPSCGLETRSWRTGRMARHKQECIRLPYTAALASQRAFFVKVLPSATKERNRERVSCFRFQTGLVSSC